MPAATAVNSDNRDARVEDYLDDKLQSLADLESLDALLSNVQNQHNLLRKQLEYAEKELEEAETTSDHHRTSLRTQAAEFRQEQDDIDRRLKIITGSEVSDDAVRRFEKSMDKLHRLDVACEYVELLKEVDSLRTQSVSELKLSHQAAIVPLRQLQTLNARLQPLQVAAEGAAPHLLDHVVRTTKALRTHIRDSFASDFEKLLKKIYWPRADVALPTPALQQEWADCIGRLLDLQKPELEAQEEAATNNSPVKQSTVLLPLEVLAHALEVRFQYHFNGDRPTNRLDKPEYFLSHVTGLLDTYNDFVIENVQPVLREHFRGTSIAMNSVYIDATSAFITSLLPMLRKKIFPLMPQVAGQPQLLSHWIHEILEFDTHIRDEWGYDGGHGILGWKGLAWEVLVTEGWFGRWLHVEREFALARYESIISNPDSSTLDYDSVDPHATKPTAAAIRVNDLLETITDRYRPLSSFQQKLRFLIDIQIAIFDRFHSRLHDGLEAYLSLTTSVGRSVSGISREEQAELKGVKGLDRLCRIFGSADYLERAMRDWSDDVFFLELWDELQDQAKGQRGGSEGEKGLGEMSVRDVALKTSSKVGTEEGEGGLFDETAAAYQRLRVRTEGVVVETVTNSVKEALRRYAGINPWASLSMPSVTPVSAGEVASSAFAMTSEIEPAVSVLSSQLAFLSRAMAPAPLRRVARQACLTVQSFIWDRVLMANNFSAAGAAQLKADLRAIVAVVDRWVGRGQGEVGLKKLVEGVTLLNLPIRSRSKSKAVIATAGQDDGEDNAWGEAEEATDDAETGVDDGQMAQMGLWEANERVFADNESAREVLDELGLEVLTEMEARNIVGRRVEVSS
ncbi:MAG: hypothetical protein M1820_007645 [Bogoriella megaspora]|nr:MAG: hypothetical protein M1820_007645 [Bogoriella megaspora]